MSEAVLSAPVWGVEFGGSPSPDHVDVRSDEVDARWWLRALAFCGNQDARLVVDEGRGWRAAEAVAR
ncbi:hypothetical protein [Actinomadura decatromicini]|uniref:Uncharacterized protein n=1 Tax=Actinomadura decatromicini TaxID=2604572 RepID=A0A5D3FB05_9ACTN|nr:hypothetical protein [Actinomadura decatromicini]TYK45222.1 hypothetical protein FXF68_31590 [Actinomadura decatromicini]